MMHERFIGIKDEKRKTESGHSQARQITRKWLRSHGRGCCDELRLAKPRREPEKPPDEIKVCWLSKAYDTASVACALIMLLLLAEPAGGVLRGLGKG